MELFGVSLELIYLYTLFISGGLTILLIFFNDLLHFEGPDFLNPTLILSFITFLSSSGYLLELYTELNSGLIAGISIAVSFLLVTLLNLFVLIPLSSAEESISYSEGDLKGRVGMVITSIPTDGFGEVLIDSISGSIAKPAAGFENEAIPANTKVLIIDVKKGVLYVSPLNQIEEVHGGSVHV